MYSMITRWHSDYEYQTEYMNDRQAHIRNPERAAKFREYVAAGVVSNGPGPNCYVTTVDNTTEICNSTWTSLEAVTEWAENCSAIPYVISIRVIDENGNTLITIPN